MQANLLSSIQKGQKLKKAQTNDRSQPAVAGGVIENGKPVKSSNPRPAAAQESRPTVCANPLFAGGIPKLRSTGSRPGAPSSAPAQPPMRPPVNAAPRTPVPPPAPAAVRRPVPPPAPVQPAMPQLRRAPEPVERGMSRMGINEAPIAPFSVANLRKTGIDMTKQRSAAPPPPPPQMEAPIISRTQQPRPVEREISVPKVPTSTGLASANGRWKFPMEDDELPTPPQFQGIKKVYPSGRTNGTTVEFEPVKINRPAPVSAALPSPMLKKPVPAVSKSGNPADMIDQKMRKLNDELKSAVANEEFELCIEIRGRIKKLKALKEDSEQGFEISPAEINAA